MNFMEKLGNIGIGIAVALGVGTGMLVLVAIFLVMLHIVLSMVGIGGILSEPS